MLEDSEEISEKVPEKTLEKEEKKNEETVVDGEEEEDAEDVSGWV